MKNNNLSTIIRLFVLLPFFLLSFSLLTFAQSDLSITVNPESNRILGYGAFPFSQMEETFGEFTVEVSNNGDEEATAVSITANFQIPNADDELETEETFTADAQDIAAGETVEFIINADYLPEETNIYAINFTFDYDQIEDEVELTDNLFSHVFVLTEYDICRALIGFNILADSININIPDILYSGLSFDDSFNGVFNAAKLAGSFEVFEPAYLEIADFTAITPTGTTAVEVWTDNGNLPGDLIATSGDFFPTNDDGGQFFITSMTCPVLLEPGKYWISLEEPLEETVGPVFSNYYATDGEYSLQFNGGNWFANPITTTDQPIVPHIYAYLTPELTFTDAATGVELEVETGLLDVEILASPFVELDDGIFAGAYCGISWTLDGDEISDFDGENIFDYEFDDYGSYEICVIVESFDGTTLEECTTVELECSLEAEAEVTPGSIIVEADGGSGNYEYDWDTGDDSEEIFDLEPETEYTVTISEDDCSEEFTFETAACEVSVDIDDVIEENGEATFELDIDNPYASSSGSTNEHTIVWTDPNGDEIGDELSLTIDKDDLEDGDYTITVTDPYGCETTLEVNLSSLAVSIDDIEGLSNFELYPNPSAGEMTIDFDLDKNIDFQMTIFNIAGEKVMETTTQKVNTLNQTFDLSEFANGVYMIQFTFDNKVMIERLVISK